MVSRRYSSTIEEMSQPVSTARVLEREGARTTPRDRIGPIPTTRPLSSADSSGPSARLETATLSGAQHPELDGLSAHWRIVFDLAEDALTATNRCGRSLRFAPAELHERLGRLAKERAETASLLDTVAREEHVRLEHSLSIPRVTKRMLGLPQRVHACVFDLEGVLAGSARLHAAAWAETFDQLLSRRVEMTGERFAPFRPFDAAVEYDLYIHGKPRLQGVLAFLASRGIRLPDGSPADGPDEETVWGLANRKRQALLWRLESEGVTAFGGARLYLEGAHEAGLVCAVVSASANTSTILERAGLDALIDEQVDGTVMETGRLQAKPEPDTLLAACAQLGVAPSQAATFETTLAGVEAGRDARLGLVIAIDRRGAAETFRAHGADLVVPDLTALLDRRMTA
jgi:beta-phosphoglucomutase-like phosphatase (HAD superfamily)